MRTSQAIATAFLSAVVAVATTAWACSDDESPVPATSGGESTTTPAGNATREISGIRLLPVGEPQPFVPCPEVKDVGRPLSLAEGTPLEIRDPEALPAGMVEQTASASATTCEDRAVGTLRVWTGAGGEQLRIGRVLLTYAAIQTSGASADEARAGEVGSHPAVFIEASPDGRIAWAAMTDDGSYVVTEVTTFDLPFSETLRIAEAIASS